MGDRCPGRVGPSPTPGEAERLRHSRGDVSVAGVRAGCLRGVQDLLVPEAGPVDLGEVQDVLSAGEPCVHATATLTLALPKHGLLGSGAVGELCLGDISVPPWLYERLGVSRPRPFGRVGPVRLQG